MNLTGIREALAAKIRENVDTVSEVSAYAGMNRGVTVVVMPGSPYIVYFDPSTQSATTFGGYGNADVNVVVVVNIPAVAGMPEEAQRFADDLLGVGDGNGKSIVDGLMKKSRDLGGLVSDLIISRGDSILQITQDGQIAGVQVLIPLGLIVPKNGAQT